MSEDKKMPMESKPMESKPKMPGSKTGGSSMNAWMIVSAVLAIIIVILILAWPKAGASNADLEVISTEQAGEKLLTFVNKIYGPQIGISTLKSVAPKSGIYEVTLTVDNNGEAVDQVVFMTQDGLFFIPQALEISQVESEYETFLQQQQQEGVAAPTDQTLPVDGEQPENPEDGAAL